MNIIEGQCPTCYRTFNPDVLKRHMGICNKVNTKVRKPMDTQKQRVQGTDIVLSKQKTQQRSYEEKPKKANWKEKHEEFLRNIRYAREAQAAEERGEQIAPPPPSQKPSDHVDCPTCGRSFNPSSAERHITFCAEQARRRPANQKGKTFTDAAARREKMMGFKSTFDKKKQQTTAKTSEYSPTNYGTAHSRTLRAAENKSAPNPRRPGPPSRHTTQVEIPLQEQEYIRRPANNANRMNGGAVRNVSSARGGEAGSREPPFCYHCGIKYPVKSAKFCCECGSPRLRND